MPCCSLGLRRGERLLMVVKDCPAFFYLFWGAIKAGIVPVPLNTLLRSESYAFMIDDSGAAALVYSPEYASEVEPAVAAAKQQPRYVLRTEGEGQSLAALIAQSQPQFDAVPATAEDDCFWLYLVRLHRLAERRRAPSSRYGGHQPAVRRRDLGHSRGRRLLLRGETVLRLWTRQQSHLSALGRRHRGAERPAPRPGVELSLIERLPADALFRRADALRRLSAAFRQREAGPFVDPLLRIRGRGAASEILRRWHEETGLWILDGIGSTEALHIFISNTPGDVKPGVERPRRTRLSRPHRRRAGSEIDGNDSGQLFISGNSTARCYWNNAERTATTMVDGWLNTGDTYRRDADGYFYYSGRSDDMLKVGGIWCSPFEIESKLIEHPNVVEAAVVGRLDQEGLIKPEAFVILKEGVTGSPALAAELSELCKNGLAPYKYPRWINFVTELPKTATGKIQRFMLRQKDGTAPAKF